MPAHWADRCVHAIACPVAPAVTACLTLFVAARSEGMPPVATPPHPAASHLRAPRMAAAPLHRQYHVYQPLHTIPHRKRSYRGIPQKTYSKQQNDKKIDDGIASSAHSDVSEPVEIEAWNRGRWLVILLVLQSASSSVLAQNRGLIEKRPEVSVFATLVIGAGGNAGAQSATRVVRALAVAEIDADWRSAFGVVLKQTIVGLALGSSLSIFGFARIFLTERDTLASFAISTALAAVVSLSCTVGSSLPFLLRALGIDAANAGSTIQVMMDVFGTLALTSICNWLLR